VPHLLVPSGMLLPVQEALGGASGHRKPGLPQEALEGGSGLPRVQPLVQPLEALEGGSGLPLVQPLVLPQEALEGGSVHPKLVVAR